MLRFIIIAMIFIRKTHTHTQKERKNTIQKDGFKAFKDLLFSEKYSKYYIKFYHESLSQYFFFTFAILNSID